VRIAYTDEQEIQHALDNGALVLVVPTVDTVEEARQVVQWAYFPPFGKRSQGGGLAFDQNMWGSVPRRLSRDHQRQSRRHRDDRIAGRPEERRGDRESAPA
jgi:2-keto-3-deoxy-L-rhamnonate aldolase RhmA